jgi:hypothetical protein
MVWCLPSSVDKTPAAKSYETIFFITTFGIAFYQSNLSTVQPYD